MRPPEVSICIPTHNQARYLRDAIATAQAQEGDVEIVVSDNHSTDGTRDVLSDVGSDRRIRIVRPDRFLPMSVHWHFCVDNSRGMYFNLLSSDDRLLPSYVGALVTLLRGGESTAFAYCAAELIDARGRVFGVERHIGGAFVRSGDEEMRRFVRGAGCVFPAMLIRRSAYDRAGGFGSWEIVGDWDLELRLLGHGGVAYWDAPLVQYRVWSNAARAARLLTQIREIGEIYDTTVAKILVDHPDLVREVRAARQRHAASAALALGRWRGTPTFSDGVAEVLRLHDSAYIRLLLRAHSSWLSPMISSVHQLRWWARQKVKARLYA